MPHVSTGAVRAFLFADLRDYTAFVEREGDRAAAALITRFRALIRSRLAEHDGAELKTEGDSFYIVFPAPSQAVSFGVDAFRAANDGSGTPLRFGVGIHVGETVPLDGQFVGSAVNLAARVGAMAADGELLVTDTVRGLIRTSGAFTFDDRGPASLKGVSEPIHLYAVEWRPLPMVAATVTKVTHTAPAGVFVGRDAELAVLVRAAGQLDTGRGQNILIGGTAGLGKTRLLRQWSASADALVLVGASGASDARSPYEPFVAMLRRLTRISSEEARLRRVAPELIALLPELASGQGQRQTDRDTLFGAFLRLIRDLARTGGVAIAVEDLHWADDGTLALVRFLAGLAEATPFLFVATYRDDELQRGHPLRQVLAELGRRPDVTTVVLHPLSGGDARTLLQATRDSSVIDEAATRRIVDLAEGNPLFIEELARSASQADPTLPLTIAEAVLRRVSLLDEDGRRLVTYAAAAGPEVSFDLLQRVLGRPEREVLRSAKAAIDASLLAESGETVTFRHALTREAVYRDLMQRERRLLHHELADALAQMHGEEPARAAEIERQYLEAGLPARALPFAMSAGEEALRLLSPVEAIAHFERAIDASGLASAERAGGLLGLGRAYRLRLDVTKAVETLSEAVALFRALGQPEEVARALRALAQAYPFGREERAAWLDVWEAVKDTGSPALLQQIASTLADRAFEYMDDADARRWTDQALALATRTGSPASLRTVEANVVLPLTHPAGWHVLVERHLGERLQHAIERDENVLSAYRRFIDSRAREADTDERDALLARARSYGTSHAPGMPRTLTFRAGPPWMLWLTGQWDDLEWFWSDLAQRYSGDDLAEIFPDTGPLAAAVRLERDGPERVAEALRATTERQARSGTWHARVASGSHLGNLELATGRGSLSAERLGALFARRTPQALELPSFVLAVRIVAPAALSTGAAGPLEPWLAADAAVRGEGALFSTALDHVAGVRRAIDGDTVGARGLLAASAATYERLGWEHLAAELAWQRARLGDDTGLEGARAFYAARGAHWRLRWLEEERWR